MLGQVYYEWHAVMVSWDLTATGADSQTHLTLHPHPFFHNSKQLHKHKKCIAKQINNTD